MSGIIQMKQPMEDIIYMAVYKQTLAKEVATCFAKNNGWQSKI
jgi:hypothetical protein